MEKTLIQPIYKFETGDNLWFTSDTHFCHENIIRFSGRPFRDAAEMNEELTSTAQKAAFKRLQDAASDIVEISVGKGQSLKEAIGRRVALLSGNVRYVYVGTQPLEDFRCVMVDKSTGITEANVDTAIQILK